MRVYTIYLSTEAAGNLIGPVEDSNLANVQWMINWNNVFGEDIGKPARVKYSLQSLSQNGVYTWAANSGTVRVQGLPNGWSNSNQGLILGDVTAIDNPVAGHPNHILFGNTMEEEGTQTVIPYGNAVINVLIMQRDGVTLQPNIVDYQMILKFIVE